MLVIAVFTDSILKMSGREERLGANTKGNKY